MGIDLDDMFTTLGRHADTIPLAPPDRARKRGQQRTRTVVAAVAAVGLLAAGVGVVIVRHDRQSAPVSSPRGLAPVGAPIDFGGQARAATTVGADGRLYTAWQTLDGPIRLSAADLRTGAVVWPARQVAGRTGNLGSVRALPQGLLVFVGRGNTAEAGTTLQVHDPRDGSLRWQLPFDAEDALIPHDSGLVRMSAKTGRTAAFDWASGAERWQLPATADRPKETLGSYADGELAPGRPGLPADDRLVQVTAAGRIHLRDIRTGGLLRTVAGGLPDADRGMLLAYGDRLFSSEYKCCEYGGYRIRRTDLRTDRGTSTVIVTEGAGTEFDSMQPCGDQRLCVIDRDRAGVSTVTAVDITSGRRLWRASAPGEAVSVATVNGFTLAGGLTGDKSVLDRAGRPVFSTSADIVEWLTEDSLLLLPGNPGGPVSLAALPDGRITQLGRLPARSDPCAWTQERLACPAVTSLQIWSLSG